MAIISPTSLQLQKIRKKAIKRRKKLVIILGSLIAGCAAATVAQSILGVKPVHNSILRGDAWIVELLDGHPSRMYNNLGMHKHVFCQLTRDLRLRGLDNSRSVSTEEQVAIFLYICVTNLSNRKVAERFQRSGDTISRSFHRVLEFLCGSFYNTYVTLPTASTPPEVYESPKFYPYFKDAVGAIDGTHILAHPTSSERPRYRNRKGDVTQNVLAACSFDMRFVFLMSGWEGSAHDSLVFQDAVAKGFQLPEGKYFLADAGFGSSPMLLTPYRGVRYHLREWAVGNERPQNAKELYNLRHSSLRNVVERIFGVLKKRWKILREHNDYSTEAQACIVPACCALSNFVKTFDPEDADALEKERDAAENQARYEAGGAGEDMGLDTADDRRDAIAEAMWMNYQSVLSQSSRRRLPARII